MRVIALVPTMPGVALGFSLIELMTAIAIFGILVVTAIPMYGTFIANTQIRTATESMLAGVRLAQTEAVRRNGTVEFLLDPATGWTVNNVEGNVTTLISGRSFKEGSEKTAITAAGAASRITFNGLGRIVAPSPVDGSAPLRQVDVTTNTSVSSPRNLRLVIGAGGDAYGIKACDPAVANTEPAGCP
ncbi:MAG: GspH/FimT family pseudopilin [Casimicrobiaceae bacterium]